MRRSRGLEVAPVSTGRRTEDRTSRDERDAGIACRSRSPCSFSLCVQLPLKLRSLLSTDQAAIPCEPQHLEPQPLPGLTELPQRGAWPGPGKRPGGSPMKSREVVATLKTNETSQQNPKALCWPNRKCHGRP